MSRINPETTKWKVGALVAYVGSYDRRASAIYKIEKVHKTGHIFVRGLKYRADDERDDAYQTGATGWSRSRVSLLTPDLEKQVKDTEKLQRIADASAFLRSDLRPDDIPDDVLASILALAKAAKGKKDASSDD